MAEYIEREALLKEIDDIDPYDYNDELEVWLDCHMEIKNAPTADVVEVVRCKDCVFYFPPFCQRPKNRPHQTYAIMPNDYCSYGERKE